MVVLFIQMTKAIDDLDYSSDGKLMIRGIGQARGGTSILLVLVLVFGIVIPTLTVLTTFNANPDSLRL